MEEYLLDCLDMLSRAGDDEVRRQNEIKKSPSWDLLDMEWKALAMVGAKKTAGEKVDSMANGGVVARTRRGGRRGGRARRGIEDRVASPQSVIGESFSPGYKLAVMIVQKHRMKDAWGDGLESEMNGIRQECTKGIHPVWERLARESPLLAELGLFPVVRLEHTEVNSMAWIEGANFDYRDFRSLREWLSSENPLKLSAAQMKVLKKIQSDLSGRPRPSQWEEWMSPSLEGMSGEASLLEGILLAAGDSERALEVLEGISGACSVVSSKHAELINARNGHFSNWSESSSCKATDGLSLALRVECWKGFKDNIGTPELEDMIEGHELLEELGEDVPSFLKWTISEDLIISNRKEEALEYILGSDVSSSENVSTCLELLDLDDSGSLEGSLRKHIDNSQEEDGILMILNHDCSTSSIRLHAASMLSSGDSIRHMDGILSAFTRTAEIGGLAECLIGDRSLSRAYPFRAMVAWHLISANESVGKLQALEEARKTALISIELAKEDSVLSEVSIGLISLLDGIPGDMSPVYDRLDSKGSRALNEVRVALSPKGNEVVRESSIEALGKSVDAAHLDAIERRLFEALVSALVLNRAALDLQIGELAREESALTSLESLVSDESVSMRTVKFASDLVFEHRVGIEALDSWYNENDRSGVAHQVVRAALLERKGEFVDAARAHRMAAMGTIEEDLERSATFLRRSLISFAHGGRWKDAVSLIDEYPTISASVTKRFKLYLRVCMDQAKGDGEKATWRLMEYVSSDLEEEEGVSSELEGLESLWMYPDERNLPPEPFRGRVVVAKRKLRHSAESAMTQLDRDFEREIMRGEDTLKLVTLIEQISGDSSIRGLRLFERAIGSGKFDEAGNKRLRDSQRILFTMKKDAVSIKERRNLKSLSLKPLVLIDTNILIDALKDDLLRDISGDSLGSLDWSINRAFHWMLRRRRDSGEILLSIPSAARSEFLHRVRTPDSVLRLFDNTYVDRKMWNKKVSDNLLEERVKGVLSEFENWSSDISDGELGGVELEDFLVEHGATFRIVDEHKRERQDTVAPRTVIGGEEIYPEKGDCDIMREASVIADSFHPGVGSVVVATRDSDFKLVSRALEESFGFGVVGDAQQLRLLS
jgi:hypothetical protein